MVLVERGLGDSQSSLEIVFVEGRVDGLVAVLGKVGRFDAALNRMQAVEEEDLHGVWTSTTWTGASARIPFTEDPFVVSSRRAMPPPGTQCEAPLEQGDNDVLSQVGEST